MRDVKNKTQKIIVGNKKHKEKNKNKSPFPILSSINSFFNINFE
ncbi:MAG: hypothetical protein ACJAYP_000219 [Flavobacterium sp.]|jgi:hypothetical protein